MNIDRIKEDLIMAVCLIFIILIVAWLASVTTCYDYVDGNCNIEVIEGEA